MELKNINDSLKELTLEEAIEINGGSGESGWYWLSYGIGAVIRGTEAFVDGAKAGSSEHMFYK